MAEIFTEDLIDKVAVHDSSHFEVKLDYSIDSETRANRYRIASYFFIPRTLGINKHTYPREQFFSDVQAYIRFKTPMLSLDALADPDDAMSPMHAIRATFRQLKKSPGEPEVHVRLVHDMRMFGCIARANFRDRGKAVRESIRSLPDDVGEWSVLFEDLQAAWRSFLDDINTVIGVWRKLRADVLAEGIPRVVEEAYLFVDEYLSLQIEDKLTDLLREIDARPALHSHLEDERTRSQQKIIAERKHRRGAGYPSIVREGADNEHYLFRQSMLKKFVMSVLWLEISKEKEASATNWGAAVAAGLAMAVALALTIVQSRWILLNTWSFVAAGTITYILKDRIKDWLKHFFSSRLGRFIPDYSVTIREPATGRDIGRCGESFHYLTDDTVPEAVLALRRKHDATSIETMAKPEVILKYEKDVRLEGDALGGRIQDYDINDIMRFGVSGLFNRADDPQSPVSLYDPETGRVERRMLPRVYHLNVVLVLESLSAPGNRPLMKRLRVVFDRNGIRRLEHVA